MIGSPELHKYYDNKYTLYETRFHTVKLRLITQIQMVSIKVQYLTQGQEDKKIEIVLIYNDLREVNNMVKSVIYVINTILFNKTEDLDSVLKTFEMGIGNYKNIFINEFKARTSKISKINKWKFINKHHFSKISELIE